MSTRVISLAPDATDVVSMLRRSARLVAVTSGDRDEFTESLPIVDAATLDDTAVRMVRAQLVVVHDDPQTATRLRTTLSEADVLELGASTLDDLDDDLDRVGTVLEAADRAERIRMQLRVDLNSVAQAVAGGPRPSCLVLRPSDPLQAVGGWVVEVIRRAGGDAVLASVDAIHTETDVAALDAIDPDLVVVAPRRGGDEAVDMTSDPMAALGTLRCAADDRLHVVSAGTFDPFCTPRRAVKGARLLASLLHPRRVAAPGGR